MVSQEVQSRAASSLWRINPLENVQKQGKKPIFWWKRRNGQKIELGAKPAFRNL